MKEKPIIIKGGNYTDKRGVIRFVNDFSFLNIKRFYLIKHPDTSVIRAWQGHQYEMKYFYPITGSFVVAWLKINNFNNPLDNLISEFQILSSVNSELISLPKGFANGLKALEPNSEISVSSDMELENSVGNEVRFEPNKFFDLNKLKTFNGAKV